MAEPVRSDTATAGGGSPDELVDEVDEVDEFDRFVRRTTRSRLRRENLWHRCVWVFVRNSAGRVFIHQRTETKDVYPGYWDVAAGGVLGAGEIYDAAARREVAEELGVTTDPGAAVASVRYEDPVNRVVGRAYVCLFDGEPVLQAEEVQRGRWVSPADLVAALEANDFCPDGLHALAAVIDAGGLFDDGDDAGVRQVVASRMSR
jgi:8-oxo-dGTP pyrophosphatase MutT (NUDIX family)